MGRPKKTNIIEDPHDNEHMIAVRVSDDLNEAIGEYADAADEPSLSAAMRSLISMGLETAQIRDGAFLAQQKDNAERQARMRMYAVLRGAYISMLRAFNNPELEFEEAPIEE